MSKRCELQKEYYEEFGKRLEIMTYKEKVYHTNHYVKWLEDKILNLNKIQIVNMTDRKEYSAKYYKKNKEKMDNRTKLYYKNNKEFKALENKKYRDKVAKQKK
jgi:hypothetical protein